MFYIFYGPDEFSLNEAVRGLRKRLVAADPMAELNFSDLDGRKLTVAELASTAETMPFLSDRRLVVARGLLGRLNPRGGDGPARAGLADGLTRWLPTLPATTRLVFVEDQLHANNPVLRWANTWRAAQPVPDAAVLIREYTAPKANQLPQWLAARAAERGGVIEPTAAIALTTALTRDDGVDLRLANMELEKLLTYAGDRPVNAADVAALVTSVSIESIFKLIDALADRQGPTATTLLHQLLAESEPPLRLLSLVARQFRLLLQTRALLDAGVAPAELNQRLPVPPFVVRKLVGQSRRFSLGFLEAALVRLLAIDTEIKTGRIEGTLALDLFVAGVCGPANRPAR